MADTFKDEVNRLLLRQDSGVTVFGRGCVKCENINFSGES